MRRRKLLLGSAFSAAAFAEPAPASPHLADLDHRITDFLTRRHQQDNDL